ncbi:MAG: hypothetical protein AB1508_09555 [Pseudomonadota bacterium]
MAGLMMKTWDRGWEPVEQRQTARPKPRLERPRSELPRGGKDIGAQIGAEMRAVFTLPTGTDDLLAQLDRWHESRR